jgi:TFIIF-interacting CTD phosphatase-like protein
MVKKLNIILDLDQTLICSEELKSFVTDPKKMKMFDYAKMDDMYITFARPHLQEFLDYLFKNFRVSIWTAASKSYALFIINKFIKRPNRRIDFIFFSYHCDLSTSEGRGLKGLDMLWETFKLQGYQKDNTIIIDDNYDVKKIQVCNCYHIKPFNYKKKGSENDTALIDLMTGLKNLKPDDLKNKCTLKRIQ